MALPTHHIQWLPQSEVDAPVHRAVGRCLPESPTPPTVLALTPFFGAVLPQQHDNTREQPQHLVVEYRLRDRLITAELVRQCIQMFQK
ncbi:MAG: hypothetical protein LC808_44945 [Actinobacteria bacterium]|nr:hypothetical protein [Actinomycetota bacterium]